MPFKKCNGISVYFEIHGNGEPLVLISGLGGDHTFWDASVERLASRFGVVVYDIRGIGKTDAPDAPYSMDMFADDLIALLDVLGIEKANILGFSMGGNIVLATALKYPERINKLVIASSFAVMNIQARMFLDAVLSVNENGASARQMFELICPWLFSNSFLADPVNAQYLQYDDNEPDQQPFYAWRNQYLAQRQFDVSAEVSVIKLPTLVIAGEKDRLAHPEDSLLLANNIQNSVLKIIPESGHLTNIENPDLFHKYVLDFL